MKLIKHLPPLVLIRSMQTTRPVPEIQSDPIPPSTVNPSYVPIVEPHPLAAELLRKSEEPIF